MVNQIRRIRISRRIKRETMMSDKDLEEYHNIGKPIKYSGKYKYVSGQMYEHHGTRMYDFGGQKLPSVTTILGLTKNQQFLKERNDVIRKYNFLVQAKKEVEAAELAGWNRKLPENKHYKFEEFKADVLESGKVRYVVKMKRHTLPSGKKIKLATKEDKK